MLQMCQQWIRIEVTVSILYRAITFWQCFRSLLYLVIFCLYTYPLVLDFSTHFFADQGDGLQNVWNIWWVNKAVTQLHQLPWQTSYLHYPNGVSLLGSTLNPFNGFVGIVLLPFLTLVETHNVIVIFSFVLGGVTTFWLAYYLTGVILGLVYLRVLYLPFQIITLPTPKGICSWYPWNGFPSLCSAGM